MAAYVIADVDVTDPATFQEYGKQVPATVTRYGGRYLARGGKVENIEGSWEPSRLVIIEFPSMEEARTWYRSEEYRGPLKLRHDSANTNVLFIEGV